MKHKEKDYIACFLCPDGRVSTGFATDSNFLSRGIMKPSFKITGSYSTVLLSRSRSMFLEHSVIAKPELVDVVNMLLHYCITLTLLNLG